MSAHDTSHATGQALCDALLNAVRDVSGDARRRSAKGVCSIGTGDGANFAYVYHLKTRATIKVYFRSEPESTYRIAGMTSQPTLRAKVGVGWAQRFPYFCTLASPADVPPFAQFLVQNSRSPDSHSRPPYMPPEELIGATFSEGGVSRIVVNRHERDPRARAECIRIHGAQCLICLTDLGAIYGTIASGFVHVHHLTPLSLLNSHYNCDPRKDLIPVCPNCHAVLHREDPPLTPEAVRALIAQTRPALGGRRKASR